MDRVTRWMNTNNRKILETCKKCLTAPNCGTVTTTGCVVSLVDTLTSLTRSPRTRSFNQPVRASASDWDKLAGLAESTKLEEVWSSWCHEKEIGELTTNVYWGWWSKIKDGQLRKIGSPTRKAPGLWPKESCSLSIFFLGAKKHLYNWLCPSVCWSVCNAFVQRSTRRTSLAYLALFLS